MSNVSSRHNVLPFTAGKSEALTGQRLAKVGYKTTAKNPAKYKSVCVSIPPVSFNLNEAAYQDTFTRIVHNALESAQDGIIRSLYESSGGQLSSISDDEISVQSCIAFIESEFSGGRLTKELITSWFNSSMSDNLTVVIADKLGFSELTEANQAVIDKHLNAYRDLFCSLAGGKTVLEDRQIKSLQKALELCTDDSDVGEKLSKRLNEMGKKEKIEDLLEL